MLPLIGSRDYLARLIKHLQSHLPDNFALDKNIFLGILLSLIAGQRNLIVDVDVDGEDGFDEDSVELKEQEGRGSSKKVKERRLQDRLERVSLMCETVCVLRGPAAGQAFGISEDSSSPFFLLDLFRNIRRDMQVEQDIFPLDRWRTALRRVSPSTPTYRINTDQRRLSPGEYGTGQARRSIHSESSAATVQTGHASPSQRVHPGQSYRSGTFSAQQASHSHLFRQPSYARTDGGRRCRQCDRLFRPFYSHDSIESIDLRGRRG